MESVSRNIVLDLLPACIAGEASQETRALVEEFALHDPGIARLIRAGALDSGLDMNHANAPEDLEMKAIQRVRRGVRRKMVYVAMATASILMIPLVALLLGAPALREASGLITVMILNSGFAAMFALSALLFWSADRQRSSANQRPGTERFR